MTEGKSKQRKQNDKRIGRIPEKKIADSKKAKLQRIKEENKWVEICWWCNRPKVDCICWRPTKYDHKYCEDMVNYFEKCQAEILVDVKFFQPNKNSTISTILNPHNEDETVDAGNVKEISQKLVMTRFPTFVRYARSIWVNKTTLYEWADKHPEFSNSLRQCNEIAEIILLENWLQWIYNSQFTQFLLKNNYGYKDKTEVETKQSISFEITDEQRAKLLERMELDE